MRVFANKASVVVSREKRASRYWEDESTMRQDGKRDLLALDREVRYLASSTAFHGGLVETAVRGP